VEVSHEAVKTVGLAGAVVAKGGFSDLRPLAICGANPLISVKGLVKDVAVLAGDSPLPVRVVMDF